MHRESVSIYVSLQPVFFAFDSISPPCSFRLAPSQIFDRLRAYKGVTSFRLTILCVFRVVLFTGFLEVHIERFGIRQFLIRYLLVQAYEPYSACFGSR